MVYYIILILPEDHDDDDARGPNALRQGRRRVQLGEGGGEARGARGARGLDVAFFCFCLRAGRSSGVFFKVFLFF